MKKTITESQLKGIIFESIKNVLSEMHMDFGEIRFIDGERLPSGIDFASVKNFIEDKVFSKLKSEDIQKLSMMGEEEKKRLAKDMTDFLTDGEALSAEELTDFACVAYTLIIMHSGAQKVTNMMNESSVTSTDLLRLIRTVRDSYGKIGSDSLCFDGPIAESAEKVLLALRDLEQVIISEANNIS